MSKILVVDDEFRIRQIIRKYAEFEGYEVEEATDGMQAIQVCRQNEFDLIIMDVMMPELDGLRATARLREESNIPIILLTAKSEDNDKILGLNIGADDYITKPFNPLELVARVNSNIRRLCSLGTTETGESKTIKVRDLVLDTESCTLSKDGNEITLSSVEYKIMEMFMLHPGKVFTKQQIYEYGWGEEYIIADNNIMVCISKLRAKLGDEDGTYIKTIRGLGYRLEK